MAGASALLSPHQALPALQSSLAGSSSSIRRAARLAVPGPRRGMAAVTAQAPKSPTQEAASEAKKYELTSPAGKSRYEIASGQQLAVASAGVQAFVRFGSAAFVSPNLSNFRKRPEKPLEIYEFEACPFCRKVREAISILDLDVIFYPCPAGGPTFRPKARQLSGKSQFPFLVDPNNGRSMLESDAILSYLWDEYGDGKANIPFQFKLGPLTTITAGLGQLPRGGNGSRYRASKIPKEPITFWAYEASPFCKLARETLTELELPHLYKSVARNSPKRAELISKWQVFQVPYIEDPNTGVAMFETQPIQQYLEKTYAV